MRKTTTHTHTAWSQRSPCLEGRAVTTVSSRRQWRGGGGEKGRGML